MTNIEPPTDDLRALFETERDLPDVERVAIKHKLAATIAAPAAATTTIASTKLLWIAAAAAAIAAAAGIWWATQRSEPASTPPAPSIEPAPMIAPEPTITTTSPEPAPPSARETPSTNAPSAQAPAGPSQTELLAQAWQALATRPAESLRLVELDAKLHAKGALGEERDALQVQALAALGRRDDAKTLATRFLARYPQSVHRKAVEGSLR